MAKTLIVALVLGCFAQLPAFAESVGECHVVAYANVPQNRGRCDQKKTWSKKTFVSLNLNWKSCQVWARDEILKKSHFKLSCFERSYGRGISWYDAYYKTEQIELTLKDEKQNVLEETSFPKSSFEEWWDGLF